MNRKVAIVVLIIIAVAIVAAGVFFMVRRHTVQARRNLPQQIKVKLPSGEVVTAYRIAPIVQNPPSGTRMIMTGRVTREKDDLGSMQLVLQTEVGTKYILLNPPYMYRLEKDGLGKMAKVKGVAIAKTSFKNYPAIYIEDILDIY